MFYINTVNGKRILIKNTWVSLLLMALAGMVTANPDTIRYHFDSPQYERPVDSVLNLVRARLDDAIGPTEPFSFDMYLVSSQTKFDLLMGRSLPEWGAAFAVPQLNRIVIKSPESFTVGRPVVELAAHEYTHLVLHERVGWRQPPRWFNEGLAQVAAEQWDWSGSMALGRASLIGGFIPLKKIDNVNSFGEATATLAYAQSFQAFRYFRDQYGQVAIRQFLDSIAAGVSVDTALWASIGLDYDGFQAEYEQHLRQNFNLASLFSDTMYLWIALAIVVIVGAVLRWRSRKAYYRKWDEQEAYESTDFEYGDPDNPEALDDDEPWRS